MYWFKQAIIVVVGFVLAAWLAAELSPEAFLAATLIVGTAIGMLATDLPIAQRRLREHLEKRLKAPSVRTEDAE